MKTTDQIIQLLKAESKKNSTENPLEQLKQVLLPALKQVEKALTIPDNSKQTLSYTGRWREWCRQNNDYRQAGQTPAV